MPDDKTTNISSMINDPAFVQLSPAQQKQALYGLTSDEGFNSLSDSQVVQFTTHSRLTSQVPRPQQPKMQMQSWAGDPVDEKLAGLSAQGGEGYASDEGIGNAMGAAGAGTVLALGAGAAGANYGPAAVKAISDMATAHPVAAGLIKKALEGAAFTGGGATVLKHVKWIKDLL